MTDPITIIMFIIIFMTGFAIGSIPWRDSERLEMPVKLIKDLGTFLFATAAAGKLYYGEKLMAKAYGQMLKDNGVYNKYFHS